jgi:predicted Zn-dependent peptidase
MLQKFYRDWYAPNNAIFVIVGDVDPARTMTTVNKLFVSITAVLIPKQSGKPIASEGFTRSKEPFVSKNIKSVTLPYWSSKLTRALPNGVRNKNHLTSG